MNAHFIIYLCLFSEILYNFDNRKKAVPLRNGDQNREPSICRCPVCVAALGHPLNNNSVRGFQSRFNIPSSGTSYGNRLSYYLPPHGSAQQSSDRITAKSPDDSFSLPNNLSSYEKSSSSKKSSRQNSFEPNSNRSNERFEALKYWYNHPDMSVSQRSTHHQDPQESIRQYERRPSPIGAPDDNGSSQTELKTVYHSEDSHSNDTQIPSSNTLYQTNRQLKSRSELERNSWHGEHSPPHEKLHKTNSDNTVAYNRMAGTRSELQDDDADSLSSGVCVYNNNLDMSDSDEPNQRRDDMRRNIKHEHSNSSNGGANERERANENIPLQVLTKSKISVFITYSWNPVQGDDELIFREMKAMIKYLPVNRVRVTVDKESESFHLIRHNKLDWLDKQLTKVSIIY